jgi:hypothetical protein
MPMKKFHNYRKNDSVLVIWITTSRRELNTSGPIKTNIILKM